jgi:hypothetical protein
MNSNHPDDEVSAAEFEATINEWATSRPPRQARKAEERKSQQTKAERSRGGAKGETKSSAINIRTTPAIKATLDKASKAVKQTATQYIEDAIAFKAKLDRAAAELGGVDVHALLDEMIATATKSKKGRG